MSRHGRPARLICAIAGLALAQDVPEARFGTTVVVPAGLRGLVYRIRPGSNRLPDFAKLKPEGIIYTSSLNVPSQSFRAGFPGVTRRFEYFAIDYNGRFWIERPGEYRFSLTSDDGADLWIDGRLIVDNDGVHPALEASGAASLSRGVHEIRVAYFQGPRFEVALILKIAAPGEAYRVFSTADFKPPPDAVIDAPPADQTAIDNEFVRITRSLIPPRQKTQPREHPFNRVLIYLDAATFEKQRLREGQAAWSPSGMHSIGNAGSAPVRVIEIELKKPAPVNPPVRAKDLDPVLIDPKHNLLLFENDQVRVFRSWREPGASEYFHEHTGVGRVGVFLTDIDATIRSEGPESKLHAVAGDVTWSGPAKHTAKNTGTRKFEMIVVEVK